MHFGRLLKITRMEKGWNQEELGKKMGVSRQAVVVWEKHEKPIRSIYIDKLCQLFDKNKEYWYDTNTETNNNQSLQILSQAIVIPIVQNIHAGEPGYTEEDVISTITLPRIVVQGKQGDIVGIIVKGSCMAPKIEEGDILILRKSTTPINGQVVIAETEDGPAVRRLKLIGKEWYLTCDCGNPKPYKPKQLVIRYHAVKVVKDTKP